MDEIELSVVIAAYNEERRLPNLLDEYLHYLPTLNIPFEITIVDDGSKDRTKDIIEDYSRLHSTLRLISHSPNRGRGFSIRKGILEARGKIILETDADGSVDKKAIKRFYRHLKKHREIGAVFGSRELKNSVISKKQPALRVFLGKGFILLARLLFWSWSTTDFTLGFKMFQRDTANDIFKHQYSNHYVAEAEIVYVSKLRKWKTIELPVTWSDNKDSKVKPFKDSLKSLNGLTLILWRAFLGKYN